MCECEYVCASVCKCVRVCDSACVRLLLFVLLHVESNRLSEGKSECACVRASVCLAIHRKSILFLTVCCSCCNVLYELLNDIGFPCAVSAEPLEYF